MDVICPNIEDVILIWGAAEFVMDSFDRNPAMKSVVEDMKSVLEDNVWWVVIDWRADEVNSLYIFDVDSVSETSFKSDDESLQGDISVFWNKNRVLTISIFFYFNDTIWKHFLYVLLDYDYASPRFFV